MLAAITPLSDNTSCQEKARIVKLVQNGAMSSKSATIRKRGGIIYAKKNASGQETMLDIKVAIAANCTLRSIASVRWGVKKKFV